MREIIEPDPPAEEWYWPLARDGRSRLRRLGTDGRYVLSGILDGGGQAFIWYARDVSSGRPVAIKTLRPDGNFGGGRVAARRMIREARIMQSLAHHPGVMPLLDCGPACLMRPEASAVRPNADDPYESRDPWLVLPLVAHYRLSDLVDAGPVMPHTWLDIAAGYAEGLAHLHRAGVIHRDLSPGNVLLSAAGPVITDFGVSWSPRWIDLGTELAMSTGLTREAAAWTEDWHAPEILRAPANARPDREPAYDVFSWGLFVAGLAGRRHPWSTTIGHLALNHVERDRMKQLRAPYDLASAFGADRRRAALVRAALDPEPGNRPTPVELVRALRDGAAAPVPARTTGLPRSASVILESPPASGGGFGRPASIIVEGPRRLVLRPEGTAVTGDRQTFRYA